MADIWLKTRMICFLRENSLDLQLNKIFSSKDKAAILQSKSGALSEGVGWAFLANSTNLLIDFRTLENELMLFQLPVEISQEFEMSSVL